jgi:uncharacterized membrane protein YhfC
MRDFLPHLNVGVIWYDVDLVRLRITAASEHSLAKQTFTRRMNSSSDWQLIWPVFQRISAIGVLFSLLLQPAAIVFRLNSG